MTSPQHSRQARRAFLFTVASAILLSACATGSDRERARQPGASAQQQVALLVPLTGEDAAVGQSIANAARLALADMNNSTISLTVYNTSDGGAPAAAGRAIGEGSRLILGPLLADQVRVVAPIARRARVPVIAYSNDQSAAGAGVYILGFVPAQSIERVVAHARASGATRFAALTPATLYGQRSAQAYMAAVQRWGGQFVALESYTAPTDARAAAKRLNGRGGFDAVLIADGGRVAAAAAPGIRSGTRLLGTDLWAGERNLGATPRLRGAWYAAAPDERFRQLATRYRARFGSTPVRLASLGYDSMLLTIRAARNWSPGKRFPANALSDPEGFVGVDGVFRFGRDGVAQRGLEVRQVTANGTNVASAAPGQLLR